MTNEVFYKINNVSVRLDTKVDVHKAFSIYEYNDFNKLMYSIMISLYDHSKPEVFAKHFIT